MAHILDSRSCLHHRKYTPKVILDVLDHDHAEQAFTLLGMHKQKRDQVLHFAEVHKVHLFQNGCLELLLVPEFRLVLDIVPPHNEAMRYCRLSLCPFQLP